MTSLEFTAAPNTFLFLDPLAFSRFCRSSLKRKLCLGRSLRVCLYLPHPRVAAGFPLGEPSTS